jgi:hypothetical protein
MTNLAHRCAASTLAAVIFAAVAGCGSGSPAAVASPSPTVLANQQILAIGREYSQCVRDHGVVNYPDMVLSGAILVLPDVPEADAAQSALRSNTAAQDACQPVLARLPASAQKNPGYSAQDMKNLATFARCMRDNGIPEWPDPKANGSFPIAGTPLETEVKLARGGSRMASAFRACRQYWDKELAIK